MDEDNSQPYTRPSRLSRPTSARRGRISEDAEKRNRDILSLVRQMSASNVLQNDSEESGADINDNDEDDEDDKTQQVPVLAGSYNPKEFEHISAPSEIKELFQYITKYSPQNIELEYKLAPFIPDFIPAVGDIDAFIKVMRPDNVDSGLGLTVVDEPCTKQTDPAVVHLQLRAATKESSAKREVVKRLENVSKHHNAIDNWIKDIMELHKSKHSSSFNYSNPMPDIDTLMQEWQVDIEQLLGNVETLALNLNCDLCSLVDTICALVDIPVYESRIESLHLLFSLYSAVKNLQMKADPAISTSAIMK